MHENKIDNEKGEGYWDIEFKITEGFFFIFVRDDIDNIKKLLKLKCLYNKILCVGWINLKVKKCANILLLVNQ